MTLPKIPQPELTANIGNDGQGFPITGPAYSKRNMLEYGKAVYQAVKESSRSPGCSIANLENVRDLILRDICEAEPADPDHEQTICIGYDYLRLIIDRNLGLTSD